MSLHEILAAAARGRALANDLSRSDRDVDRHQVAAGVRHELDAVLRLARIELERLEQSATRDHPGKVRADAPATSQAAALTVAPQTGTQRWRILEALWYAAGHGATDHDLQHSLEMDPSSERPRRGELVDGGLVRAIGTRATDGNDWTVWALTQAGADAYRVRVPGPPRLVTHEGEPTLF